MYQESFKCYETIEDKKFSRNLAEVFYLLGNVYLYEHKENSEGKALEKYSQAKEILVNNLCKELKVDSISEDLSKEKLFDSDLVKELK